MKCVQRLLLRNADTTIPLFTIEGSYYAKVVKVYDGDTIHVVFFYNGVRTRFAVRLYGINAPEVKGVQKVKGLASRQALSDRILNKYVYIHCRGFGKFGRLLGVIEYNGDMINDWLVREHYAIYKSYV
jgi:micrococcal nuclease